MPLILCVAPKRTLSIGFRPRVILVPVLCLMAAGCFEAKEAHVGPESEHSQRSVDAGRVDDAHDLNDGGATNQVDEHLDAAWNDSADSDDSESCVATDSDAGAFAPREAVPQGPCDSPPVTQRAKQPQRELNVPLGEPLWFDVGDSIVIDRSNPSESKTRGKLDIGALVEVSPLAERRLLAGIQRAATEAVGKDPAGTCGTDELTLLGFDDPDRPEVLARTPIPGDIALITSVKSESSWRVYVVADEIDQQCIGPTKRTRLYVFDLDGSFRQLEQIDLGGDVAVAERRGDLLVLIDGTYDRLGRTKGDGPSARVVVLGTTGGTTISARAPAPFVGWYQPPLSLGLVGNVLGLLADDWASGGLRYVRYDSSDPSELRVLSDCTSLALSGHELGVFFGDRVIAATWAAAFGEGAPVTNRLVEIDAQCQKKRELASAWVVEAKSSGVAIELAASEGLLEARLLESTTGDVIASAHVKTQVGFDAQPWYASVVREPRSPARGDSMDPGVVCVPMKDAGCEYFSFSARAIASCTPAMSSRDGRLTGACVSSLDMD